MKQQSAQSKEKTSSSPYWFFCVADEICVVNISCKHIIAYAEPVCNIQNCVFAKAGNGSIK